jgi:DNA ligase (NAD+)
MNWARKVEHELRAGLNFAIDGGVAKINEIALQEEIGVIGGREPRWAIARKFAPDIAETKLLEIRVNVGRTGALNPYAVLEPVEIGGTTVTYATLHNEDLILRKDLRIGDRVQVKRAGEVIRNSSVPSPSGGRDTAKWRMPAKCPACGTAVRDEARRCTSVRTPRVREGVSRRFDILPPREPWTFVASATHGSRSWSMPAW